MGTFSVQSAKDWLQKKTGTDLSYLFRNGAYVFSTEIVAALSGFFQFVVIGRWLPSAVYGQYKYFLSLHALFAVFTLTGIEHALGNAIANHKDGSVVPAFRTKMTFGFVGSLIVLLGAALRFSQGDAVTAKALLLISIFSPIVYAYGLYARILIGKRAFHLYAQSIIFSNLTTAIPMVVAFIFIRSPLILFGIYLASSLTNLLMYRRAKRLLSPTNTTVDEGLIPYAKHLSAVDALSTVANAIDGVIIYHLLGTEALAVYALAILPVEQLRGILKTVQAIATPKFATQSFATIATGLKRKIWYFVAFAAGTTALYLVISPYFYAWLLPAHVGSVPYSQGYSLALAFAAPTSLIYTLFLAQGSRKRIVYFNVFSYSLQIVLLITGTIFYGIAGTIGARVLTYVIMFFISHVLAFRTQDASVQTTAS